MKTHTLETPGADLVHDVRGPLPTAGLLGQRVAVFPSHHGGFCDGEFGYPGKPDEFARRLREVLDGAS